MKDFLYIAVILLICYPVSRFIWYLTDKIWEYQFNKSFKNRRF